MEKKSSKRFSSRSGSRQLSLTLDEPLEADSVRGAEASLDIGETTLRAGGIAINGAGVWMSKSSEIAVERISDEDLDRVRILGRGCSGQVILFKHKTTGQLFAVKIAFNVYDKSKRDQLFTEIETLYSIKCPWLVQCHGAFYRDSAISVILEYCDLGSLDTVVVKYGKIPEKVLAAMTFQMLCGLAYLRNNHRFHRDIKPQNILLMSSGNIKLTDFGLAKDLEDSLGMANTFVGTFRYMSPERIQSQPYNFKSDIWSLGLVLVECATGSPVYPDAKSHIELVHSILESPVPTLDEGEFSSDFVEFINCCLKTKPDKRLPAEILLGSPWLQENNATGRSLHQYSSDLAGRNKLINCAYLDTCSAVQLSINISKVSKAIRITSLSSCMSNLLKNEHVHTTAEMTKSNLLPSDCISAHGPTRIIEGLGWSSPNSLPYRPLGAPDLSIVKHSRGGMSRFASSQRSKSEKAKAEIPIVNRRQRPKKPRPIVKQAVFSPNAVVHLNMSRAFFDHRGAYLRKQMADSNERMYTVRRGRMFADHCKGAKFPSDHFKIPHSIPNCTLSYPLPSKEMRTSFHAQLAEAMRLSDQCNKTESKEYSKEELTAVRQSELTESYFNRHRFYLPYTNRQPHIQPVAALPTIATYKAALTKEKENRALLVPASGAVKALECEPEKLMAIVHATNNVSALESLDEKMNAIFIEEASSNKLEELRIPSTTENSKLHPVEKMQHTLQELSASKAEATKKLATSLESVTQDRLRCFYRKQKSYENHANEISHNIDRIRCESELERRAILKDTRSSCLKWYTEFLTFLFRNDRVPTMEESFLVHYLKLIVENGFIFERPMLMGLVACFSNEELDKTDLQEAFRYLRTKVLTDDISIQEWTAFFEINSYPEPLEVLEYRRQQTRKSNNLSRFRKAVKTNMILRHAVE